MIVAHLFGGPRDGLVLVASELTPLVIPIATGMLEFFSAEPGNVEPPTLSTVTYIPRRDTLQQCRCRPDCPHSTCTYYVSGWGR